MQILVSEARRPKASQNSRLMTRPDIARLSCGRPIQSGAKASTTCTRGGRPTPDRLSRAAISQIDGLGLADLARVWTWRGVKSLRQSSCHRHATPAAANRLPDALEA